MYAGQGSTLAVSSHAVLADKFQNPLFHNFTIWYQKSITHKYKIASVIWILIDVIWLLYLQLSETTVFVGGATCHWSSHTLSSLPANIETSGDFEAMNLLSGWTCALIKQIIKKYTLISIIFYQRFSYLYFPIVFIIYAQASEDNYSAFRFSLELNILLSIDKKKLGKVSTYCVFTLLFVVKCVSLLLCSDFFFTTIILWSQATWPKAVDSLYSAPWLCSGCTAV